MIVSSMSYDQLEREVNSDYLELKDFILCESNNIQKKYKGKFKSLSPLKRALHFESEIVIHKTSKHNSWFLILHVYKRGINFSAHLKTETQNGYRFITTSGGTIFIHSNHFFSRYNKRYLSKTNPKTNNSWIHFFVNHPLPLYTEVKYMDTLITSNLLTIFKDGVGLSTLIENHDIIEVGTFVSYNMLKKNQLKLVVELVIYIVVLIERRGNSKSEQILKRDLMMLYNEVSKKINPLMTKYGIDINNFGDLKRFLKGND